MIEIINGNLFDADADIICHQCNCKGVMGSGVAAEAKRRYPKAFESYRRDYEEGKLELGYVNFAQIKQDQVIANMCGQDGYGRKQQHTDYAALQKCLDTVRDYAIKTGCTTIAFPYLMSCCRGGGSWTVVSRMIDETFGDFNVKILKYTE